MCYCIVFPSKSKSPGVLYLEGRFNGGVFTLRVWGAYIWRGLYMKGLMFSEFYGILNLSTIFWLAKPAFIRNLELNVFR